MCWMSSSCDVIGQSDTFEYVLNSTSSELGLTRLKNVCPSNCIARFRLTPPLFCWVALIMPHGYLDSEWCVGDLFDCHFAPLNRDQRINVPWILSIEEAEDQRRFRRDLVAVVQRLARGEKLRRSHFQGRTSCLLPASDADEITQRDRF